jgi:hypothetical protein
MCEATNLHRPDHPHFAGDARNDNQKCPRPIPQAKPILECGGLPPLSLTLNFREPTN